MRRRRPSWIQCHITTNITRARVVINNATRNISGHGDISCIIISSTPIYRLNTVILILFNLIIMSQNVRPSSAKKLYSDFLIAISDLD